jgi:ADP-ribose pyrophosphatase YjhB (NUDIX family)
VNRALHTNTAQRQEKPYLGHQQVVEQLVSEFAREVMDVRHAYRAGQPGAENPVERIEALAKRSGDIFTGQSEAYTPAPWNTPTRLGSVFRFLAPAAEIAKRPGEPGTAFFIHVAQIVTAACLQLERGEPEARIGADLQTTLQSVVTRIMEARTRWPDDTERTPTDATGSLSDAQTVHAIVRTFAAELLRHAADSPGTLMTWLDEECRRMNLLFVGPGLPAGRYSELQRTGWNSPDCLGTHLCIRLALPCETRRAARDTFVHFASAVLDTDELPEAEHRAKLDKLCDELTAALLGTSATVDSTPTAALTAGSEPSTTKSAPATLPVCHPRTMPGGKAVRIEQPSTPTPLATWGDASAAATVVPDGPMPAEVGAVAIAPLPPLSTDTASWEALATSEPAFEEPPFTAEPGLRPAAGVAIEEPDGRVWLVSPTNAFGGYASTLPKGCVDGGLSMRATAVREALEEAGLLVQLTGHLVDCARSTTMTRYYRARRVGGNPAAMCWESQAVHLVPRAQLAAFLTNPSDASVLKALLAR